MNGLVRYEPSSQLNWALPVLTQTSSVLGLAANAAPIQTRSSSKLAMLDVHKVSRPTQVPDNY